MKPFFKELFEYNFNFNQKILNTLDENHEQISHKLVSLQNHIINVHGIWNAKILSLQTNHKPWDIHTIKELTKFNTDNLNSSLYIIDKIGIDLHIQFTTGSGITCHNSIKDMLFQIINHSTYHRGQIATELRSCNIEPLVTDWIFYKMNS